MECDINKVWYFIIALIWNVAIFSVVCFFTGWTLDILGAVIDSKIIREFAYGVGLLATISMFWFGLLAAILSVFVKCKKCGSRIMILRSPFFVSSIKSKCVNCKTTTLDTSKSNA